MRMTILAAIVFIIAIGSASAATPELWAIDVGPEWTTPDSYSLTLDPFNTSLRPFVYNELRTIMDATYDPINSKLYVSGWGPDNGHWGEQNTLAAYDLTSGGMSFVSLSNADMDGYYWLGGISYLNGSVYAICMDDMVALGNRLLIRIDNPATASQSVAQIGDTLGETEMGIPFGLCVGESGSLLASFHSAAGECLYSIDPLNGTHTLLHTYSAEDIGNNGAIEALEYFNGDLVALTTPGNVYVIDTSTYDLTLAGQLPSRIWTCLIAVPEPGTTVMMLGGFVALGLRRRKS